MKKLLYAGIVVEVDGYRAALLAQYPPITLTIEQI